MSINKSESQLDAQQVLRGSFDDDTKGLRVIGMGGSLVPEEYDRLEYTATSSTVDTWVYKSGGASGTTVATITITYTDVSKETISSVQRT